MNLKTFALTVFISLALAHQCVSSERLFTGRKLAAVSAEQKAAFNKVWNEKTKALNALLKEQTANHTKSFKEKKEQLQATIKTLRDQAKAGTPYEISPTPTKDQRAAAHKDVLLNKKTKEQRKKQQEAVKAAKNAHQTKVEQIDVSNPPKASTQRVEIFKKKLQKALTAAEKSLKNKTKKLDNKCKDIGNKKAIKKLTNEFNKSTNQMTKDLTDQMKVAGSDQTLISQVTKLFSALEEKLSTDFKAAKLALETSTEVKPMTQECTDSYTKLEEEQKASVALINEKHSKLIANEQEQIALQTSDPSKVPTAEQLKVRNQMLKDAKKEKEAAVKAANDTFDSETATISKSLDPEVEAWKAKLTDAMSADEKKKFINYKMKTEMQVLKDEHAKNVADSKEVHKIASKALAEEKKVAWKALTSGNHSTQV